MEYNLKLKSQISFNILEHILLYIIRNYLIYSCLKMICCLLKKNLFELLDSKLCKFMFNKIQNIVVIKIYFYTKF